jgi:solute:Na+ symporter, SSS family
MMSDLGIIATVCTVYFAVVLAIGAVAARRTTTEAQDYFLGGRQARTLVLFMALFGTNVTPFVLLGVPGLAYHEGVGVFGYNAAIVALGIPLTFWLIGRPAWHAARACGAITPAELYALRLDSPVLGVVLFVAYTVYTLPYLVTSVLGVALATETFTGGAIDGELAAAILLAVSVLYTTAGGMRATMWTNVLQGAVFMVFIVVAAVAIARGLGGAAAATAAVERLAPELLVVGDRPRFALASWGSWSLAISLTVIAFPHMLVRVFAARDQAALRNTCRLYPPALLALWLPAVLIGVWGAAAIPGLAGRASDRIFPLMVSAHTGPWMQGLGLAAILAAVMSTLDAQFLTLSSMLGRDALRRVWPRMTERTEIRAGQGFSVLLAVLTFVVVLRPPDSIFGIATFSFSGYVMLVPTLYLGLCWPRFTARAAIASIVAGNATLLLAFAWGTPPGGVLPVAWGLLAAIVFALGVAWRWPRAWVA